jgi:hypothetical protein
MNEENHLLGRFLEFSIPTSNIIESLGFYKLLGFQELTIGDVWTHKYAVVSDGVLNIGLLKINPDVFNELCFSDRDKNLVAMIEARTFSPADEYMDDSICGNWFEISLPVRDAMRAAQFWAPLAPELLRLREEPTTHMRFNAAEMSLGLSESIALNGPSLCFRCDDKDAVWTAIAQHGFKFKEFPGFEGAFMALTAPEGSVLYLFAEDFLGELYEVAEGEEGEEGEEEEAKRSDLLLSAKCLLFLKAAVQNARKSRK